MKELPLWFSESSMSHVQGGLVLVCKSPPPGGQIMGAVESGLPSGAELPKILPLSSKGRKTSCGKGSAVCGDWGDQLVLACLDFPGVSIECASPRELLSLKQSGMVGQDCPCFKSESLASWVSVLSSLAAVAKYHRLSGLNHRHLYLTVLEAGESKIKLPAGSCSSEHPLPGL